MLDRIIKIRNGDKWVNFKVYRCDSCDCEIKDCYPHVVESNNTVHYCGECAFKLGKITAKQYVKEFLYFIGIDIKAAIHPETREIEVAYKNKKFSWEMKDSDYRRTKEYKEWRINVFERDDYTCQECGQRGGALEGHHIKPFKKYKADRFIVKNGVTLCKPCHKKVHKNKDGKWLYVKGSNKDKRACGNV